MSDFLTPLPPGSKAPDFMLHRSVHEGIALSDARGRPLVLVFYPGAWEPVSTSQLMLCQEYVSEFQRLDALLVGISVDSVWTHLAFAKAYRLEFPLLADFSPRGKAARAYGVFDETDGVSGRALFVIDGEGTIHWSRTFPLNLNPGVDGVLTALETLYAQPPRP